VKLTPVANFTNILWASFAAISVCKKIQTQTLITDQLCKTLWYGKSARKMLLKFTPAQRPFWKRRRRQRQRLFLHLLAGQGGVHDGVVVQEGKVVVRKAAWTWLLRGLPEFRLPAQVVLSTGFHHLPKPVIFQPAIDFTNMFRSSFYMCRSQKRRKTLMA